MLREQRELSMTTSLMLLKMKQLKGDETRSSKVYLP